ncbi:MAG: histidine phosphatase family protein [Acidimicrobiia bacterium]
MSSLYLVRHAKAGDRHDYRGDDRLRPLTKPGWRQAEGLVALLADVSITRLLSSPYTRCMQTLEPLAAARSMPVEPDPRLAEGNGFTPVLALFDELGEQGDGTVLCSHGDVIPEVVDALVRRGARMLGQPDWRKGATWKLDRDGDTWISAAPLTPG